MKLSKLYSNKPEIFSPIEFNSKLNVVIAEIRLPENLKKDTHNLGKTTLGRILDFVLLSKKNSSFFLFKHYELFKDFVFFLEIKLEDNLFITIRRSVEEATKTAIKRHKTGSQDFSKVMLDDWDHQNIPFNRSRDLLDSLLDWRGLSPWSYRKILGYLIRSQEDFREVFQLGKFAYKHAEWKPFLAHLLGFNASIINDHYIKTLELSNTKKKEQEVKQELGGSIEDISKIEGLLLLKQKDADKKQKLLDAFDFRSHDKEHTKKIVDEYDERIAILNSERYSLNRNKKKIQESIQSDQILFDPKEAQALFKEVGVLFKGQIKKDFDQLIAFNKAITEERRLYLQEELSGLEKALHQINMELNDLGKKRTEALSFLSSTDIFDKYKMVSDEMVVLQTDISFLEQQKTHLGRLQGLRTDVRNLTRECAQLQEQIEEDVEKQNSDQQSLFSSIRVFFSDIVEKVINRKALLSVSQNQSGHIEFRAEILDDSGNATSADLGNTYRKLLCVAFDLAVLRAHINQKLPRFVFHDGVLESLDDRKKENLISVVREYADLGLQPIITLIDSDLPKNQDSKKMSFTSEEIVLMLNDENDQGRLFKMSSW